jgi:hypothetical protein
MMCHSELAPEGESPTQETEAQNMSRVCARVFLYTQGLSLDPLLCMELSLESLRSVSLGRKIAQTPDFAAAMDELRRMLREKGLKAELSGPDSRPLRSAPPLNRRHMLPGELGSSILRRIIKKIGLA